MLFKQQLKIYYLFIPHQNDSKFYTIKKCVQSQSEQSKKWIFLWAPRNTSLRSSCKILFKWGFSKLLEREKRSRLMDWQIVRSYIIRFWLWGYLKIKHVNLDDLRLNSASITLYSLKKKKIVIKDLVYFFKLQRNVEKTNFN